MRHGISGRPRSSRPASPRHGQTSVSPAFGLASSMRRRPRSRKPCRCRPGRAISCCSADGCRPRAAGSTRALAIYGARWISTRATRARDTRSPRSSSAQAAPTPTMRPAASSRPFSQGRPATSPSSLNARASRRRRTRSARLKRRCARSMTPRPAGRHRRRSNTAG